MMGSTHFTLGLAGGLLAGLSPWGILAFSLGSVFPDKVDFFFAANDREKWSRIHRTWSHSWWFIIAVGLAVYAAASVFLLPVRPDAAMIVALVPIFFAGMLFHVACDFLTPAGIPFVWPNGSRRGLGIVKARGPGNTFLFFVGLGVSVWVAWSRMPESGKAAFYSLQNLVSRFLRSLPSFS